MTRKILIVDDDPNISSLMEDILSPNFEVVKASDGLEAVEKANQAAFNLILMDLRLPMFSGLWFCRAFKKKPNTRHIPIVVVSAALDEETEQQALELGVVATLKKPFRNEELLDTVNRYVA
jgi:two-component system chemotaxis response regulator CheY